MTFCLLFSQHLEGLINRGQGGTERRFGVLYGLAAPVVGDVIVLMSALCHESTLHEADAQQAFLEQNSLLLPTGRHPLKRLNSVKSLFVSSVGCKIVC